MLYLISPSQKDLDCHFQKLSEKILKALTKELAKKNNAFNDNFVTHVQDLNNLKLLLTDKPSGLINHHETLMKKFIPTFDSDKYDKYFESKSKKLNERNTEDKRLVAKYEIVKELFKVFNYDSFISGSKSIAYDLAKKLNRNTCTYCNRLYSNTVTIKNVNNNSGRIVRPQFDHWYAKSRYPALSLSYFNLIPSCYVCNSSVKGDAVFSLNDYIHPYAFEKGQDFKFSYNYTDVHENNIKIIVTPGSKIAKTLEGFKIQEVYDAHSNLELKDLLELRHKYSDNYLDILINDTFGKLPISRREAYRLIFGVEYKEIDFHKRPFSKFKRDILKELGID